MIIKKKTIDAIKRTTFSKDANIVEISSKQGQIGPVIPPVIQKETKKKD